MTPTHIIIHCSDTADSGTVSWQAIRRFHVEYRGWSDIGYHAGIELINDRFEILLGRMFDVQGAHCSHSGMNYHSIGICCVGKFDTKRPPGGQVKIAQKLSKWLMDRYKIPVENVFGHGEIDSSKTCPGMMFDMVAFREGLT